MKSSGNDKNKKRNRSTNGNESDSSTYSNSYTNKKVRDNFGQSIKPQISENELIIRDLTILGTRMMANSDKNRDTHTEAANKINQLKITIEQNLNDIIENQRRLLDIRDREISQMEYADAEANILSMQDRQKQEFFNNLIQVKELMGQTLIYSEDPQVYESILNDLRSKLIDINTIQEPDHLARVSEIFNIMYNKTLEQVSIGISNVINDSPDKIKKITAILASMLMLYSYQTEEVRNLYNNIPYFGLLFQTINKTNNILRSTTNVAGTITSIYYLLRNSGIDIDECIGLVRNIVSQTSLSAAQIISKKSVSISTDALNLASKTANITISVTESIINSLSRQLANQLGNLLTSNYQDIDIVIDSQDTLESVKSVKTPISYHSADSLTSTASYKSVQQLLETSIEDGGIDGIIQNQNLTPKESETIETRFNAIADGISTNPIIKGINEEGDIIEQGKSIEHQDSQNSTLSDESVSWNIWLYGKDNVGGKRRRKSFRNIKLNRSKKIKKVKKIKRSTRKDRRRYKTTRKH